MGSVEKVGLSGDEVSRLYVELGSSLQRYLVGLLRDDGLAADVLQSTFAKLIEDPARCPADSARAWLFKVATNEALSLLRRQRTGRGALEQKARSRRLESISAADQAMHWEAIERVKQRMNQLPEAQRMVVRMRIYEGLTFAEIASSLELPLGTVLTRMRSALKKLQIALGEEDCA